MDEILKYYCDESIDKNDRSKIDFLLEYCFNNADFAELNVLYEDASLDDFMKRFEEDIVSVGPRYNKINPSYKVIKLRLSTNVKLFVKSKGFHGWLNSPLEDIAFLKNEWEILATDTHENQVFLRTSETFKNYLNNQGFNFVYDYGEDPRVAGQ